MSLSPRPLTVAVLIDLERRPDSGGHVKCWERLAEAAAGRDGLDLTLFVQGPDRRVEECAPNVRYNYRPPALSSAWMPGAKDAPDHSDLAPLRPGLLRDLADFDVLHTTDAFFAMAATARKAAKTKAKALVTSLHTDTPGYTRIYSERMLRTTLGDGALAELAIGTLKLPERLGQRMKTKLLRMMTEARFVLAPPEGLGSITIPGAKRRPLRRGIDRSRFNPDRRDRSWLEETFAIPPTRTVLVFTGRLSVGKSVMTAARATRQLLDQGADVHFIAAGAGPDQAEIAALLGDRAALPGMVDQDQLGRILASGDLFVFPSQVEVAPNAVLEAKSSGLVPLVAPDGGGRFVASSGYDGLVIDESDPGAWASAVSGLMGNRAQLQSMRAAALKDIRDHRPTWRDVLDEDLMPVWQEAFALSGQR